MTKLPGVAAPWAFAMETLLMSWYSQVVQEWSRPINTFQRCTFCNIHLCNKNSVDSPAISCPPKTKKVEHVNAGAVFFSTFNDEVLRIRVGAGWDSINFQFQGCHVRHKRGRGWVFCKGTYLQGRKHMDWKKCDEVHDLGFRSTCHGKKT